MYRTLSLMYLLLNTWYHLVKLLWCLPTMSVAWEWRHHRLSFLDVKRETYDHMIVSFLSQYSSTMYDPSNGTGTWLEYIRTKITLRQITHTCTSMFWKRIHAPSPAEPPIPQALFHEQRLLSHCLRRTKSVACTLLKHENEIRNKRKMVTRNVPRRESSMIALTISIYLAWRSVLSRKKSKRRYVHLGGWFSQRSSTIQIYIYIEIHIIWISWGILSITKPIYILHTEWAGTVSSEKTIVVAFPQRQCTKGSRAYAKYNRPCPNGIVFWHIDISMSIDRSIHVILRISIQEYIQERRIYMDNINGYHDSWAYEKTVMMARHPRLARRLFIRCLCIGTAKFHLRSLVYR